jgi:O-antigen/teichoic acid export membrane protein
MGVKRTILRNVFSNWTGYAVNVVVALLLSPFIVRALGDDLYGFWVLIISLSGYYGVLDMGIRSAVGQYVTRYWAQGDVSGINRTMNTAVVLMSGAAVLVIIASLFISLEIPDWFSTQEEAPWRLQWSVAIMGLGIAIGFPLAVYGSATVATQRYDLSNLIAIAERLISAGMIVWVLGAGYGLLGFSIVITATTLLGATARLMVAFRLLPGLVFSPRAFARSSLAEIAHYGFFSFIIRVADQLIQATSVLVIGAFMTTVAVTYYAIGANLIPYYVAIITGITWTLMPLATAYDAQKDGDGLRRLWLAGTRAAFALSALIAGGLIFLGHDFLSLWMGEKYVLGEPYPSSATILAILAAGYLVRLSNNVGVQVLFGMRRVRLLAALFGAEAMANLVLSVILIHPFGLVGVAMAVVTPMIIIQGLVLPLATSRRLGVPWGLNLCKLFWGGLSVLGVMTGMSLLLSDRLIVTTWTIFMVKAALLTAPAFVCAFWLGTSGQDKTQLLTLIGLRRRPGSKGTTRSSIAGGADAD